MYSAPDKCTVPTGRSSTPNNLPWMGFSVLAKDKSHHIYGAEWASECCVCKCCENVCLRYRHFPLWFWLICTVRGRMCFSAILISCREGIAHIYGQSEVFNVLITRPIHTAPGWEITPLPRPTVCHHGYGNEKQKIAEGWINKRPVSRVSISHRQINSGLVAALTDPLITNYK